MMKGAKYSSLHETVGRQRQSRNDQVKNECPKWSQLWAREQGEQIEKKKMGKEKEKMK